MALDDQAVIAFLAGAYAGPVATRALWLWAGGEAQQIDYQCEPDQRWGRLWTAARNGEKATAEAVLRETLFDRPGDADVLNFLKDLAVETRPQSPATARVLVAQLETLAPAFDPQDLWPVLAGFPDCTRAEAFAALSAALQDCLAPAPAQEPLPDRETNQTGETPPDVDATTGAEDAPTPKDAAANGGVAEGGRPDPETREPGKDAQDAAEAPRNVLKSRLQGLLANPPEPVAAAIAVAMLGLCHNLPALLDADPASDWQRLGQELDEVLSTGAPEGWDADALQSFLEPRLADLAANATDAQEILAAAAAAMQRQLAALLALLREETPPSDLTKIAQACLQALWGTTAQ